MEWLAPLLQHPRTRYPLPSKILRTEAPLSQVNHQVNRLVHVHHNALVSRDELAALLFQSRMLPLTPLLRPWFQVLPDLPFRHHVPEFLPYHFLPRNQVHLLRDMTEFHGDSKRTR